MTHPVHQLSKATPVAAAIVFPVWRSSRPPTGYLPTAIPDADGHRRAARPYRSSFTRSADDLSRMVLELAAGKYHPMSQMATHLLNKPVAQLGPVPEGQAKETNCERRTRPPPVVKADQLIAMRAAHLV